MLGAAGAAGVFAPLNFKMKPTFFTVKQLNSFVALPLCKVMRNSKAVYYQCNCLGLF